MDSFEAFHSIAAQAKHGELTFSTNVSAALKVKQLLDDPNVHLSSAIGLVQADPLFAARVVAIANSVAFNQSGSKITNVASAVMRLGFGTLRTLAALLLVRQMSEGTSSATVRKKSAELWEHTASVGALAQVIARRMTDIDPDTAMFAGIVHEVGGFYLLSRAEQYPGLLDGKLDGWVEYGEKIIGRSVLKALEIPDTVCEAIEQVWEGTGCKPPVSLGDVLVLANALASVISPLRFGSNIKLHDAGNLADFMIGEDTLRDILDDATEQIESLRNSLLV